MHDPCGIFHLERARDLEDVLKQVLGQGRHVYRPWNDLGLIATMAQVLVGREGRVPKIREGGCA
jgi:hypothetical protein